MKQWYALHTKPHAEYQVRSALQQRKIQIYLPEIATVQAGNVRRKKPLFPCYLFSRIDLETISIRHILWTPGLRRIVSFDDKPASLPDQIIELIQRKLGDFKISQRLTVHAFKPGDTVRITNGPLSDLQAIFEGPTSAHDRVRILLDLLGQASRVQIDVADL
ncbi:MAG: transcription termination/antitermination NusG family protein, partial [Anaerolineae bacterium]|nr:transcription termination/antitermination NusG family protein [Anaerolineae bacterium]